MARKEKAADAVRVEREQEPKYVVRQIRVDALNTVRKRVLLTPSVCDECGLDLCGPAKLPPFDQMTAPQQELVRMLVVKHKEAYHAASQPVAPRRPVPLAVESDETEE